MPAHNNDNHAEVPDSAYARTLLGQFERTVLSDPAAPWVVLALVALVLGISTVQFLGEIQNTEYSQYRLREDHDTALGRWLPDGQALIDGQNPYDVRHWFPAPPLVLMCITPFTVIEAHAGITVAAALYALLKLAAVAAGCWLIVRAAERPSLAVPLGVLMMAALYSARPIMGDIKHGNINLFVFFEIALAWFLFVRGRDGLAGLVLGLAITTKVTPGLLLVYFLYRRQWTVVVGAFAGLLLGLLIIPGLILGWERNFELLRTWASMIIEPYMRYGYVTLDRDNQSWAGTMIRLGHLGLFNVELMPQVDLYRVGSEAMARPAGWIGMVLIRGGNLVIVAALAWLCRGAVRDRRDPRLLLEVALVLLAMLLLSERTWKHHMTTLPIVFLANWLVLACYDWSPRFRLFFVIGLLVQLAILLFGRGKALMHGGVITLFILLCFVQTATLRRRADRQLGPQLQP